MQGSRDNSCYDLLGNTKLGAGSEIVVSGGGRRHQAAQNMVEQ